MAQAQVSIYLLNLCLHGIMCNLFRTFKSNLLQFWSPLSRKRIHSISFECLDQGLMEICLVKTVAALLRYIMKYPYLYTTYLLGVLLFFQDCTLISITIPIHKFGSAWNWFSMVLRKGQSLYHLVQRTQKLVLTATH